MLGASPKSVNPPNYSLLIIPNSHFHYLILGHTVLPFGLRSAPKIFSALADALEWILLNRGVSFVIHYLDDFLTVGSPMIEQCKKNLELICAVCEELGIPLKLSKVEGPSTEIIFLGIVLNTVSLEMHLPVEKICHLKGLLATWKNKRSCTKNFYR